MTGSDREAQSGAEPESSLFELIAARVDDLIEYQGDALAKRYAHELAAVVSAASRGGEAGARVAAAAARHLHRLMAHKDEYEVARLHLQRFARSKVVEKLGPDVHGVAEQWSRCFIVLECGGQVAL